MSAERIREDHLAYLVAASKHLDAGEKVALKKQLDSHSLGARIEVLERLEQLSAGTRARLEKIWTAYGRQSLFLWGANSFRRYNPAAVKKLVAKAVARTEPDFHAAALNEEWHRLVEPENLEEGKPRVLRVRLIDDELGVTVRLAKTHHFLFEDEERDYTLTYDVTLVIDLESDGRVAKVFGAQHDGKRSMRTFLEWLFQQELPTRTRDLEEHMAPIPFAERHVKRLAKTSALKLECVGMEGPDPHGVVGKVGFEGKAMDYHLHPLDPTDARVKAQEGVPQDARSYNFTFTHPKDGFAERGRVTFYFTAQQPNLRFPVRTSQPAVMAVVNALHAVVMQVP